MYLQITFHFSVYIYFKDKVWITSHSKATTSLWSDLVMHLFKNVLTTVFHALWFPSASSRLQTVRDDRWCWMIPSEWRHSSSANLCCCSLSSLRLSYLPIPRLGQPCLIYFVCSLLDLKLNIFKASQLDINWYIFDAFKEENCKMQRTNSYLRIRINVEILTPFHHAFQNRHETFEALNSHGFLLVWSSTELQSMAALFGNQRHKLL